MIGIVALLALGAATTAPADEPVKLVFSIDQGFGNGIVVNEDVAAARRIAGALKTLRPQYDVYALFEPQIADRKKLDRILDVCVGEGVPLVFDAYSSDAMTLGTSTPQNAPADGPHGVAITIEDLAKYKRRYGPMLAGLRFMEVFSQDFTVRAIRTTNPEWKGKDWKMPPDDFFQPKLAEPFLRFAREQKMFVQWSDWHWSRFAGWDKPQKPREESLRKLLAAYPGLVTVTYANNEPNEDSAPRLNHWHEAVRPFVAAGAKGFGLSDQSWLRKDDTKCPIEDIVAWAKQALALNCKLIQFEPAWYFFDLPRGEFGPADYTKDPRWRSAGAPRETFNNLQRALLVPMSRPANVAGASAGPASEPVRQ